MIRKELLDIVLPSSVTVTNIKYDYGAGKLAYKINIETTNLIPELKKKIDGMQDCGFNVFDSDEETFKQWHEEQIMEEKITNEYLIVCICDHFNKTRDRYFYKWR